MICETGFLLNLQTIARQGHNILILFSMFASSPAWASSEVAPIHVGLRYSNHQLPKGCEYEGGSLISTKPDTSVAQIKCRGQRYLSFNRLTHRDAKGSPYWEVVALTALPQLQKGESINDLDCTNPLNGYTLAITKWRESKTRSYAYRISYAVRLNQATSTFEILDPKQVKCEYFEDRD